MGQQPLTLGAGLGGQTAAYGANVGADLLKGGLSAALTQQQAAGTSGFGTALMGLSSNKDFMSGIKNYFNPVKSSGGVSSDWI